MMEERDFTSGRKARYEFALLALILVDDGCN
jgi:hypothetical protein